MDKANSNMKRNAIAALAKRKIAKDFLKIPPRQNLGKGRMEVNPFRRA